MELKDIKILIDDMEEVILRVHTHLRAKEEEWDQFKKKPLFDKEKREKFSRDYKNYVFYKGKFYAYWWILKKLGSKVPVILENLRGIEIIGNEAVEKKSHYSEIYGHFDSYEYLNKKKVKK
jgi:hypothetical protein